MGEEDPAAEEEEAEGEEVAEIKAGLTSRERKQNLIVIMRMTTRVRKVSVNIDITYRSPKFHYILCDTLKQSCEVERKCIL